MGLLHVDHMRFFLNGYLTKYFCPSVETDPITGEVKVAQVGLRRVESSLFKEDTKEKMFFLHIQKCYTNL